VTPVPAQQWLGPRWQVGSADAIYQSLTLIQRDRPGLVLVAGADHVYRMDPNQMIQAHLDWDAGVTVAALPVPRTAATDFGVIRAAVGGHRIEAFEEKPADPPCLHGSPDEAPRSASTKNTTGPAGSWCPPAASLWSARDRWWRANLWPGIPRGGGGRRSSSGSPRCPRR
jgi:ADP-glucose pyrophosphorylase